MKNTSSAIPRRERELMVALIFLKMHNIIEFRNLSHEASSNLVLLSCPPSQTMAAPPTHVPKNHPKVILRVSLALTFHSCSSEQWNPTDLTFWWSRGSFTSPVLQLLPQLKALLHLTSFIPQSARWCPSVWTWSPPLWQSKQLTKLLSCSKLFSSFHSPRRELQALADQTPAVLCKVRAQQSPCHTLRPGYTGRVWVILMCWSHLPLGSHLEYSYSSPQS